MPINETERARPGFEPGTSRTRSKNHTPRPTIHSVTQKKHKDLSLLRISDTT